MKILMGMAVYNNEKTIQTVLDAFTSMIYPKDQIRTLFVDGGSKDASIGILQKFKERWEGTYSGIEIVSGNFDSAAKARNHCIRSLHEGEYLWFLDSDVAVTHDALNLLVNMMTSYDIASLYYTHDRTHDSPETLGIGPAPAVRTGCTLINPLVIKKIGLFNEKITELHGYLDDADYSHRARLAGFRIGFDEQHTQLHIKPASKYNWHYQIDDVIKYRRYRGWWFANKVFTRRWFSYFVLFGLTLLMPISILFGLPILIYFLAQLIRRKSITKAFVTTAGAWLLPPTSILGYFELHLRSLKQNHS